MKPATDVATVVLVANPQRGDVIRRALEAAGERTEIITVEDVTLEQPDAAVVFAPNRGDEPLAEIVTQWVQQREAAESHDALRLIKGSLDSASDAVFLVSVDAEGAQLVFANEAYSRLTGFETALGTMVTDPGPLRQLFVNRPAFVSMVLSGHPVRCELAGIREDGAPYVADTYLSAVRDEAGHVTHILGVQRDCTVEDNAESELHFMAHHDELTELPNRKMFLTSLENATRQAARNREKVGVLYLDLDGFKQVNDELGHAAGDEVLRVVARRMEECLRHGDTVARLGGDEFTAVLPGIRNEEDAAVVARKLMREIAKPIMVHPTQSVCVTPSIGLSVYPEHGLHTDELIRCADEAMYRSKEMGKATYQIHSGQRNECPEHVSLRRELVLAVTNQELGISYQPVVCSKSFQLAGVRACLNWEHKTQVKIPNSVLLPLLRELHLEKEVHQHLLERACSEASKWSSELRLTVPLSVDQLGDRELLGGVLSALALGRLEPKRLELEVADLAALDSDPSIASRLAALRTHGVRILATNVVDDVRAMERLRRVPVDSLQLHSPSVQGLGGIEETSLHGWIAIARSMECEVHGSGIQAIEQRDCMDRLRCDRLQGELFGGTVDLAELERTANADKRRPVVPGFLRHDRRKMRRARRRQSSPVNSHPATR
jgi:diguanylate cyclase (GGDEF)-like protein